MSDQALRFLIACAVIALALGVARLVGRFRRPHHPEVTPGHIGDRPGVVMFTSTECSTCKKTIALLKELQIPFREVTHELESGRFETWGVIAVPLVVFLDASGEVTRALTGTPSSKALRSAAAAAGIPPTP